MLYKKATVTIIALAITFEEKARKDGSNVLK